MRSYGIGLTRLRKLAKRIGRNRELANALWKTDVHEARVVALLVDDPALITREQAEGQVEELAGGMLAHVFASCDATLAKTSFVVELADQWVRSDDPVRRECGYGLLYEASKFSGKKAPREELFLAHVARSADTIGTESEKVRLSMGAALIAIGKRSAARHAGLQLLSGARRRRALHAAANTTPAPQPHPPGLLTFRTYESNLSALPQLGLPCPNSPPLPQIPPPRC